MPSPTLARVPASLPRPDARLAIFSPKFVLCICNEEVFLRDNIESVESRIESLERKREREPASKTHTERPSFAFCVLRGVCVVQLCGGIFGTILSGNSVEKESTVKY